MRTIKLICAVKELLNRKKTGNDLYFISLRKIQDGDWFIYNNEILQNVSESSKEYAKKGQKIEASTDTSLLGSLIIPDTFVKKYAQVGGDIKNVVLDWVYGDYNYDKRRKVVRGGDNEILSEEDVDNLDFTIDDVNLRERENKTVVVSKL